MKLTIEKLVYGGAGLARTDQGVVFVSRTAPGDVIEAEIIERKKDYSVAQVVEVLEASPDRQNPTCPNYEAAGCCHWQHIQYGRQLDIKESIIRESLQRVGRLAWDRPISRICGPDSQYRLRATFHVTPKGELGFVRERSNEVVPITSCDALAPELNDFLKQTRPAAGVTEVHALSTRELEVQGIKYRLHPEVFFQANRFLLEPFTNEVLDQVGKLPGNLLELYCGSGFFSLALARRAKQLIGVESDGRAIRQARENAKLNGVRNTEFVEGQVDVTLAGASIRPDVVVMDPPRTGTGARNAARIAALKAPRIVYVSCNPSTFAREAALFVNAGYGMERLTMVDQFPNTYHIETVATFSRGQDTSNG